MLRLRSPPSPLRAFSPPLPTRSTGSLPLRARGRCASTRTRKAGRQASSPRGERAGAFLKPAAARIPTFGERWGKRPGPWNSGALGGRGEGLGLGCLAPGSAPLWGSEASSVPPAGSTGGRVGDAVIMEGILDWKAWHPCSCGPEGPARRRKGQTHQEGALWRDVLSWDSNTPWLCCSPGGGTFSHRKEQVWPWDVDDRHFFC